MEKGIRKWASRVWGISRDLYEHPEIGGREYHAAASWSNLLQEGGLSVKRGLCGLETAFSAESGAGNDPGYALLAEYDALPRMGHGCGHNLSGAMSVLAALALADSGAEGRIVVFGTPAEETDGAKVHLSKKGAFDGCGLAAMIHCGNETVVPYRSLAMDALSFRFTGKSAHAAGAPWEGKSALTPLRLFFHPADLLSQHVAPAARIHGVVAAGGDAPNVIPSFAEGRWYLRAPHRQELDRIARRVVLCAEGAAIATETTMEYSPFELSFNAMRPNRAAEGALAELFRDCGETVSFDEEPRGSSDVGDVSHVCPAVHPFLKITRRPVSLHTPEFAEATVTGFARKKMKIGAEVLAELGRRFLEDDHFRKMVAADFAKNKMKSR